MFDKSTHFKQVCQLPFVPDCRYSSIFFFFCGGWGEGGGGQEGQYGAMKFKNSKLLPSYFFAIGTSGMWKKVEFLLGRLTR